MLTYHCIFYCANKENASNTVTVSAVLAVITTSVKRRWLDKLGVN